jgi:hypothetical protein
MRRSAADNRAVLDFAVEFAAKDRWEHEKKVKTSFELPVDHIPGSSESGYRTADQSHNDQCAQRFCGAQTS